MLCASCQRLVDAPLPAGAVRYEPPGVYATWWQVVEECSATTGDLSAVTWYQVPNTLSIPVESIGNVGGYWSQTNNEIVLAGASMLDGGIVRHEMLHALLREPGHPRAEFLGACGGTVECDSSCIADAGPPSTPDPASVSITPDKLRVAVSVTPAQPSASANDGFFALTVSATNGTGGPVIVALPGRSATNVGTSFAYRLQSSQGGIGGSEAALDSGVLIFATGETKRFVFDFRVQSPTWGGLVPGMYGYGGSYGLQWAYDTTYLNP